MKWLLLISFAMHPGIAEFEFTFPTEEECTIYREVILSDIKQGKVFRGEDVTVGECKHDDM